MAITRLDFSGITYASMVSMVGAPVTEPISTPTAGSGFTIDTAKTPAPVAVTFVGNETSMQAVADRINTLIIAAGGDQIAFVNHPAANNSTLTLKAKKMAISAPSGGIVAKLGFTGVAPTASIIFTVHFTDVAVARGDGTSGDYTHEHAYQVDTVDVTAANAVANIQAAIETFVQNKIVPTQRLAFRATVVVDPLGSSGAYVKTGINW